jgi:hypothetical protein
VGKHDSYFELFLRAICFEILDAGGRGQYETQFKAKVCTCYWNWNGVGGIVAKLQAGRYRI